MTQTRLTKNLIIWDIEANNLYDYVTKVWCLWAYDPQTNEWFGFKPDELDKACRFLEQYRYHVGHNLLDYDVPTMRKVCGLDSTGFRVIDTLIMSRFIEPDLLGGHSLKAWGRRLGNEKDSYGEETVNAWDMYSEDMFTYCHQDVDLTADLFFHLCKLMGMNSDEPEVYCEL